MGKDFRKPKLIICQLCGRDALRPPAAKYCLPCSEKASSARIAESRKRTEPLREAVVEKTKAAGVLRSMPWSISFDEPDPAYLWAVRFFVPFTYAASKNHIYGFGHHIHKRAESRQMQAAIAMRAASALRGHAVAHNKVWIGLIVEKPNHKGDAVNVVDLVCDGLKEALGIDDRWFSIAFLDWRINKNEPRIYVQLAQEHDWDALACSTCGEVKPLDAFGKKASNKLGRDRICKDCRSLGRKLAKGHPAEPAQPIAMARAA